MIRIIGLRSLSRTSAIYRVPEFKRQRAHQTAVTPKITKDNKTAERYKDYLAHNFNPPVKSSDPRHNLSDKIRADHRDASERFRNRKLSKQRIHSRDERNVVVANSKLPEKPEPRNVKWVKNPSHDWRKTNIDDKRWQKGVVPASVLEDKYASDYNEYYRESFEGEHSEPAETSKNDIEVLSTTRKQERIRNINFDYFPAPHQIGHDHKLGIMPTEILWKDERSNYWQGLQDEDNPDNEKKQKMRDKRNEWYKQTPDYEDAWRGARSGNPKKRLSLHSTNANLDTRYFDPNILRIGDQWVPDKYSSDAVEERNKAINAKKAFYEEIESDEQIRSLETEDSIYVLPSFQDRTHFPQGLPRFSDALQILCGTEIKNQTSISDISLEGLNEIEEKVKNIIRHGRIEQVDAGEFGLDQPVFDKFDPRFGSIDKTNSYQGHLNSQSLFEDQWIWEERLGLNKPERSSRIIAKNLSNLLFHYFDQQCFRMPGENINSEFPVINGQKLRVMEDAVEVWYSETKLKPIQGEELPRIDEDVFCPLQLFPEESRLAEKCEEINPSGHFGRVHTIVLHDHPTMAFEQDEMNPARFTGDREKERKFLPHLREYLDHEESIGRLLYCSYGMLYNQAIVDGLVDKDLEEPLVANGVCFSNGKVIHLIQTQLISTRKEAQQKVKVCNLGSFDLFELCDAFVWDRNDRIENFRQSELEAFLKSFKLISS